MEECNIKIAKTVDGRYCRFFFRRNTKWFATHVAYTTLQLVLEANLPKQAANQMSPREYDEL